MRAAQRDIHEQNSAGQFNTYRAQNSIYTHDGPVAETLMELVSITDDRSM